MSTNSAPRRTVLDGLGDPTGGRPGSLWQVPTFCAGVLALLVVAFVTPFSQSGGDSQVQLDLTALRRGLAQPNPDLERLLPLADDLLNRSQHHPKAAGEIHYLVGTAYMRQADSCPVDQASDIRAKALAHLEQAEARGVPATDKNRLYYRLGRVLYLSGGDLRRAIDYINRGSPLGNEDAAEGYGLLVKAYLKLPNVDLDKALWANLKQIEHGDDDGVVAAAKLDRAELLLKKELRTEALKVLDSMGRQAPRDLQLRAKSLQARCCQEDELYSRAALLWQELLAEPAGVSVGKGRILYMLGVCHEKTDPPEIAKARKAFEEAMAFGGEEAQAAALRLGDSLLGTSQPHTALPHFLFALETVTPTTPYQNSLIEVGTARELIERGCRVYKQRHEFLSLQLLAEAYRKIAVTGVAEERQAEAAEELGKHLRELSRAKTGDEAAKLLEQAKAQFRKAAAAFEIASKNRDHADHLQRLARSADCLIQAQDYALAEDRLRELAQSNAPLTRQAEAWFSLAGIYQAQKKPDDAKKAFCKCIEYGDTPFLSPARYQLALMAIERGDLKEAEDLLQQGIADGQARQRSPTEQLLVKLGELLFKQGKYDAASVRLKEAIRHYPNSLHALVMRDQLGECYRKLADQARGEYDRDPPHPAVKKSFYLSAKRDYLEQAREVYQKLADDLEARSGSPTATEERLLRKAQFVAADCLSELGNSFGEVLRRYEELARRYQNQLEGLFACQRIYSCYGAIDDTSPLKQRAREVTRAAVSNARTYLPAMAGRLFEGLPAGGGKQDWLTWLNWVYEQLGPRPGV